MDQAHMQDSLYLCMTTIRSLSQHLVTMFSTLEDQQEDQRAILNESSCSSFCTCTHKCECVHKSDRQEFCSTNISESSSSMDEQKISRKCCSRSDNDFYEAQYHENNLDYFENSKMKNSFSNYNKRFPCKIIMNNIAPSFIKNDSHMNTDKCTQTELTYFDGDSYRRENNIQKEFIMPEIKVIPDITNSLVFTDRKPSSENTKQLDESKNSRPIQLEKEFRNNKNELEIQLPKLNSGHVEFFDDDTNNGLFISLKYSQPPMNSLVLKGNLGIPNVADRNEVDVQDKETFNKEIVKGDIFTNEKIESGISNILSKVQHQSETVDIVESKISNILSKINQQSETVENVESEIANILSTVKKQSEAANNSLLLNTVKSNIINKTTFREDEIDENLERQPEKTAKADRTLGDQQLNLPEHYNKKSNTDVLLNQEQDKSEKLASILIVELENERKLSNKLLECLSIQENKPCEISNQTILNPIKSRLSSPQKSQDNQDIKTNTTLRSNLTKDKSKTNGADKNGTEKGRPFTNNIKVSYDEGNLLENDVESPGSFLLCSIDSEDKDNDSKGLNVKIKDDIIYMAVMDIDERSSSLIFNESGVVSFRREFDEISDENEQVMEKVREYGTPDNNEHVEIIVESDVKKDSGVQMKNVSGSNTLKKSPSNKSSIKSDNDSQLNYKTISHHSLENSENGSIHVMKRESSRVTQDLTESENLEPFKESSPFLNADCLYRSAEYIESFIGSVDNKYGLIADSVKDKELASSLYSPIEQIHNREDNLDKSIQNGSYIHNKDKKSSTKKNLNAEKNGKIDEEFGSQQNVKLNNLSNKVSLKSNIDAETNTTSIVPIPLMQSSLETDLDNYKDSTTVINADGIYRSPEYIESLIGTIDINYDGRLSSKKVVSLLQNSDKGPTMGSDNARENVNLKLDEQEKEREQILKHRGKSSMSREKFISQKLETIEEQSKTSDKKLSSQPTLSSNDNKRMSTKEIEQLTSRSESRKSNKGSTFEERNFELSHQTNSQVKTPETKISLHLIQNSEHDSNVENQNLVSKINVNEKDNNLQVHVTQELTISDNQYNNKQLFNSGTNDEKDITFLICDGNSGEFIETHSSQLFAHKLSNENDGFKLPDDNTRNSLTEQKPNKYDNDNDVTFITCDGNSSMLLKGYSSQMSVKKSINKDVDDSLNVQKVQDVWPKENDFGRVETFLVLDESSSDFIKKHNSPKIVQKAKKTADDRHSTREKSQDDSESMIIPKQESQERNFLPSKKVDNISEEVFMTNKLNKYQQLLRNQKTKSTSKEFEKKRSDSKYKALSNDLNDPNNLDYDESLSKRNSVRSQAFSQDGLDYNEDFRYNNEKDLEFVTCEGNSSDFIESHGSKISVQKLLNKTESISSNITLNNKENLDYQSYKDSKKASSEKSEHGGYESIPDSTRVTESKTPKSKSSNSTRDRHALDLPNNIVSNATPFNSPKGNNYQQLKDQSTKSGHQDFNINRIDSKFALLASDKKDTFDDLSPYQNPDLEVAADAKSPQDDSEFRMKGEFVSNRTSKKSSGLNNYKQLKDQSTKTGHENFNINRIDSKFALLATDRKDTDEALGPLENHDLEIAAGAKSPWNDVKDRIKGEFKELPPKQSKMSSGNSKKGTTVNNYQQLKDQTTRIGHEDLNINRVDSKFSLIATDRKDTDDGLSPFKNRDLEMTVGVKSPPDGSEDKMIDEFNELSPKLSIISSGTSKKSTKVNNYQQLKDQITRTVHEDFNINRIDSKFVLLATDRIDTVEDLSPSQKEDLKILDVAVNAQEDSELRIKKEPNDMRSHKSKISNKSSKDKINQVNSLVNSTKPKHSSVERRLSSRITSGEQSRSSKISQYSLSNNRNSENNYCNMYIQEKIFNEIRSDKRFDSESDGLSKKIRDIVNLDKTSGPMNKALSTLDKTIIGVDQKICTLGLNSKGQEDLNSLIESFKMTMDDESIKEELAIIEFKEIEPTEHSEISAYETGKLEQEKHYSTLAEAKHIRDVNMKYVEQKLVELTHTIPEPISVDHSSGKHSRKCPLGLVEQAIFERISNKKTSDKMISQDVNPTNRNESHNSSSKYRNHRKSHSTSSTITTKSSVIKARNFLMTTDGPSANFFVPINLKYAASNSIKPNENENNQKLCTSFYAVDMSMSGSTTSSSMIGLNKLDNVDESLLINQSLCITDKGDEFLSFSIDNNISDNHKEDSKSNFIAFSGQQSREAKSQDVSDDDSIRLKISFCKIPTTLLRHEYCEFLRDKFKIKTVNTSSINDNNDLSNTSVNNHIFSHDKSENKHTKSMSSSLQMNKLVAIITPTFDHARNSNDEPTCDKGEFCMDVSMDFSELSNNDSQTDITYSNHSQIQPSLVIEASPVPFLKVSPTIIDPDEIPVRMTDRILQSSQMSCFAFL